MRIKSGQGNAVTILTTKVTTTKPRQPKTVTLSKAMGYATMPKLKQGWIGKRVQGGHAPVAYRSRSADWGMANKKARA